MYGRPRDTSPLLLDQPGVVVEEQEEHEQQEFEPREEDLEPNRELVQNHTQQEFENHRIVRLFGLFIARNFDI